MILMCLCLVTRSDLIPIQVVEVLIRKRREGGLVLSQGEKASP